AAERASPSGDAAAWPGARSRDRAPPSGRPPAPGGARTRRRSPRPPRASGCGVPPQPDSSELYDLPLLRLAHPEPLRSELGDVRAVTQHGELDFELATLLLEALLHLSCGRELVADVGDLE